MSSRPRLRPLLAIALLLLASSQVGGAQSLTVVLPIVGPLTVSSAVAGQEPNAVTTDGGTYSVNTPANGKLTTITARLAAPLPANTTLSIALASPGGGATSLGAVILTNSAQPVVTAIPKKLSVSGLSITYTFSALSAAGVQVLQSAPVILELAP